MCKTSKCNGSHNNNRNNNNNRNYKGENDFDLHACGNILKSILNQSNNAVKTFVDQIKTTKDLLNETDKAKLADSVINLTDKLDGYIESTIKQFTDAISDATKNPNAENEFEKKPSQENNSFNNNVGKGKYPNDNIVFKANRGVALNMLVSLKTYISGMNINWIDKNVLCSTIDYAIIHSSNVPSFIKIDRTHLLQIVERLNITIFNTICNAFNIAYSMRSDYGHLNIYTTPTGYTFTIPKHKLMDLSSFVSDVILKHKLPNTSKDKEDNITDLLNQFDIANRLISNYIKTRYPDNSTTLYANIDFIESSSTANKDTSSTKPNPDTMDSLIIDKTLITKVRDIISKTSTLEYLIESIPSLLKTTMQDILKTECSNAENTRTINYTDIYKHNKGTIHTLVIIKCVLNSIINKLYINYILYNSSFANQFTLNQENNPFVYTINSKITGEECASINLHFSDTIPTIRGLINKLSIEVRNNESINSILKDINQFDLMFECICKSILNIPSVNYYNSHPDITYIIYNYISDNIILNKVGNIVLPRNCNYFLIIENTLKSLITDICDFKYSLDFMVASNQILEHLGTINPSENKSSIPDLSEVQNTLIQNIVTLKNVFLTETKSTKLNQDRLNEVQDTIDKIVVLYNTLYLQLNGLGNITLYTKPLYTSSYQGIYTDITDINFSLLIDSLQYKCSSNKLATIHSSFRDYISTINNLLYIHVDKQHLWFSPIKIDRNKCSNLECFKNISDFSIQSVPTDFLHRKDKQIKILQEQIINTMNEVMLRCNKCKDINLINASLYKTDYKNFDTLKKEITNLYNLLDTIEFTKF